MSISFDFHKINCMHEAGACLSEENIINISFKKNLFM